MPKRTDIQSILIIGAGPIVIGQACEFDYSGAQACKALREEGYRVILVNSNPATIMTDPEMADATYIEPINWKTVARSSRRSGPTRCCPPWAARPRSTPRSTWCARRVLEKYGVEMIGASREAIDMAEDRELFRDAMREIGSRRRSRASPTVEEATRHRWRDRLPGGDPPVLHPGRQRRRHRLQPRGVRGDRGARPRCLAHHEVLIEESVIGWKEYEMEVVRDARTTASSSARSRTSIRWACTPATRSPWPRP
jgi:carbamoyl-phosphate synthase large subunit